MNYCNVCDNFLDNDEYLSCNFKNYLKISFNMDDLYKNCPKKNGDG